jgi:SAM-dependent methyltransferase
VKKVSLNPTTFAKYSEYYDFVYQNKAYKKEVDEFEGILQNHNIKPPTDVLELGCGTGGHALILADRGYKVTAVDRSKEMLAVARNKSGTGGGQITWVNSEIQNLSLSKQFSAALSMFDVVSYQTEDPALLKFLEKVQEHLLPGGLFYFDCWNGLAVENEGLVPRSLQFETPDKQTITRRATPKIEKDSHTVDVHIELLRQNKNSLKHGIEEIIVSEHHFMRYFYPEELSRFLLATGFKEAEFHNFQSEKYPSPGTPWKLKVTAIKK